MNKTALDGLLEALDYSPVIAQYDEMAKEMLQQGFTERECIERALEHSCDYVKVAEYIDAILENTRTNKSAKAADIIKILIDTLNQIIVHNHAIGAPSSLDSRVARVALMHAEQIAGA